MLFPSAGHIQEGVHKIAVLRANFLGDFIFCLPALEALRSSYPHAEIVFLGKPWHQALLVDRPGPVDRVIVVPPSGGVRLEPEGFASPEELESFFERMREERFDLALQLHGGGRYSNPFVLNLGARLTAGLRAPDAAPLDLWVPYIYYQSEVLRFLEVASLVGARAPHLEPRLHILPRDLAEADQVAPEQDRPLAVLHPGANDTRRRWPVEHFAAVGDRLAEAGAHVIVTGTEPERPLVSAVVSGMRHPAQEACAVLSVGGLAGLLSRSSVLVSNDSGPLHLAAAVGAATVGIYWCGNLINAGPLTRTRHRPAISWRLNCPTCGVDCTQGSCEHRSSFVADVPVDEAAASALDLMAASRSRAALSGT